MEPDRLPASAESLPPQTVQNSPARAILRTRRLQAIGPLDPATQRLNYPFFPRLGLASAIACSTGMLLGTSHGAQTAALRFRAENSHRLPNNERGWYLYHKTKNYYVIVQSAKEGFRMAKKIGIWTAVFFGIEEIVDRGRVGRAYIQRDADGNWKNQRRRKDFISTVTAGMVTSAAFSLWNRLPLNTAARMTKVGFFGGLMYGLSQDAMTILEGNHLSYIDWILNKTGFNSSAPS